MPESLQELLDLKILGPLFQKFAFDSIRKRTTPKECCLDSSSLDCVEPAELS
jgi:hypothetical protein